MQAGNLEKLHISPDRVMHLGFILEDQTGNANGVNTKALLIFHSHIPLVHAIYSSWNAFFP